MTLVHFTALCLALIIGTLACTAILVVTIWWDGHRWPHVTIAACPWCDDRTCPDPGLCDCIGPCGRMSCKAPEPEAVP